MKYIPADKLIAEIRKLLIPTVHDRDYDEWEHGRDSGFIQAISIIESLQQEQPIPDSTQLIAEWEKEKAVLEQKDFRGDAERMAYNAFLDGFVKGIGYGRTK